MDNDLRTDLADRGVDMTQFTSTAVRRLMTADELTDQVSAAWKDAEADVAACEGAALLEIAAGEEILDALFLQYAGRHYEKGTDGAAIAAAMAPPEELVEMFGEFMAD
jgi:hypothetical protein